MTPLPSRTEELNEMAMYVEGQLSSSAYKMYVDSQVITGKYITQKTGGFFEEIIWNIVVKKVANKYIVRANRVLSDWNRVETESTHEFTGDVLIDLLKQLDEAMAKTDKIRLLI